MKKRILIIAFCVSFPTVRLSANLVQGAIDVARGKKSPDAASITNVGQGAIDVLRGKKTEHADFFKDAGQGAVDVLRGEQSEDAKRLMNSPLIKSAFPIQSIGMAIVTDPSSTDDQIKAVASNQVGNIIRLVEARSAINDAEVATANLLAEKIAGDFGKTVVRVGLGPQTFVSEFAVSSSQMAKAVVEGKDPKMIRGVLLAAALRDAYKNLLGRSKPIPELVKQRMLVGGLDPGLVASARYVTDAKFSIDLPDVINTLNRKVIRPGTNHAVTIFNVIVFAKDPGESEDVTAWWAHECHHIHQYMDLGFEGFASKYIVHYSDLEREADAASKRTIDNIAKFKAAAAKL